MEYADFDTIRPLATIELRRLLREGEPVVRAWAGWELGLRIGQAADPELAEAAKESPTPGVRRLLLVILAGHGERDVLEAFALHDPDEHVRATAAQYLGMTTGPNDTAMDKFLSGVLARDPSPAVRWEVLRLARNKQAHISQFLIEACVADTDLHVRRMAAESLLADAAGRFPTVLETRPILEEDNEMRAILTSAWVHAGGARQLMRRLATAASPALELVTELLSAIAAEHQTLAWEDLAPFANRDPRVNALVAQLLHDPHEPRPFSWLLSVSLEAFTRMPQATSRDASSRITAIYTAASTAQERLAQAVDQVNPTSVSDDVGRAVVRLAGAIETRMNEEREITREEQGIELDGLAESELPPYFARDVRLLAGLRRLIASLSQ